MKNKMISMFIGFIFLVIVNIVLLSNYSKTSELVFITDTFNYSSKFALNNDIEVRYEEIDNLTLFDFEYDINDAGVVITSYKGIGEEVVIPYQLEGKDVIKIEKNTFLNSKVKRVYISSNIVSYEDESVVDLYCYDNVNCDSFIGNYNVIIQEESDIDYNYKDILFEYNIYGNEVELKKYIGDDYDIVIPYQINGYKVVSISFDLEGMKNITIPSSIKIINSNIKYDNTLFISCLFNVFAYIIFVVLSLIFIKDKDNKNDFYLMSTIYLVLQFVLSCEFYYDILRIVIYSICLIIIYILFFVYIIKKKKKRDYISLSKTTFIEDSLCEIRKYKNKNYKRIEKAIICLQNDSCIESLDVEKEIITRIQELKINHSKKDIEKINELLDERDNICKKNRRTR